MVPLRAWGGQAWRGCLTARERVRYGTFVAMVWTGRHVKGHKKHQMA